MTDLRYLIPRRIPQRLEMVPGVGGEELQVLAAAALLSVLWAVAAWWRQVPMLGMLLPGVLLCGAAFFLVRPLADGSNLWTLALSIHHYLTCPRRHLYAWDREDY
jgi:hypothetical protein